MRLPNQNVLNNQKPLVLMVVGPTASGKTNLAIALARYFNTSIISADSRQCFHELNIGVARPSAAELAEVPHHFIASHSVLQKVDAAVFEQYALTQLTEIFKHSSVAIVAGGTGMYLKALCNGLDEIPIVSQEIRVQGIQLLQQKGLAALQAALTKADPLYAQTGEMLNPQRMLRALEVVEATGKSIRHFQKATPVVRPFHVLTIGIDLPKPLLHQRIHQRVDQMLANGLLAEVEQLMPFRHTNALQTVGYKEIFSFLDGEATIENAIETIKTNTRRYAKRQLTWFRGQMDVIWWNTNDPAQILETLPTTLPTILPFL